MTRKGKALTAQTVGELVKILQTIPEDTKLHGDFSDDELCIVELWEMTEDEDGISYEAESEERVPNYNRVTINFGDECDVDNDDEEEES